VQYDVPALFKAPQEGQDRTDRVRLESVGLAHMSEELGVLVFGLADFFSILRLAELSSLWLTQLENLEISPGPFDFETACSSTIVLIP
tara:strand:- start:26 stop:289 length:264 start_codon:yes stop_codon:yes gene_type:complete